MAALKIGSLVHLKSSGRTMTVAEIASTSITWMWFHNAEAQYHAFKADSLQLHTPASAGSVRGSWNSTDGAATSPTVA